MTPVGLDGQKKYAAKRSALKTLQSEAHIQSICLALIRGTVTHTHTHTHPDVLLVVFEFTAQARDARITFLINNLAGVLEWAGTIATLN